jgi:hypothetical protein
MHGQKQIFFKEKPKKNQLSPIFYSIKPLIYSPRRLLANLYLRQGVPTYKGVKWLQD